MRVGVRGLDGALAGRELVAEVQLIVLIAGAFRETRCGRRRDTSEWPPAGTVSRAARLCGRKPAVVCRETYRQRVMRREHGAKGFGRARPDVDDIESGAGSDLESEFNCRHVGSVGRDSAYHGRFVMQSVDKSRPAPSQRYLIVTSLSPDSYRHPAAVELALRVPVAISADREPSVTPGHDLSFCAWSPAAASALTFLSGFGLGTLLLPAFGLFYPIEQAVASTAVVHFLNGLFKLALVGRHANRRVVLAFGLPAIVAALVGAWMLERLAGATTIARHNLFGINGEITAAKLVIGVLLFAFTLFELIPRLQGDRVSQPTASSGRCA